VHVSVTVYVSSHSPVEQALTMVVSYVVVNVEHGVVIVVGSQSTKAKTEMVLVSVTVLQGKGELAEGSRWNGV
jgi:transketolase N-terminal domain/subunit